MRTSVRAKSNDGTPIKGLYVRGDRFYVGYSKKSRWHLRQLRATNLVGARIERDRVLKKEGVFRRFDDRLPEEPKLKQLDQLHSDSRKLAQAVSNAKLLLAHKENRALLDEAEWMTGRAAELIFAAWKTSQT